MGTISLSWSELWDQIVVFLDGRMIRRLGKVVVGHNEQLNFFFQNHLSTRWGSNKTKSDPEGCIDKQGGISR
ncbi:hypothetical protein E1A91_D05G412900v1 [Gossypium mustelinum]|uniref:Uncharacterized protein n=1 Tax=Gossypium mustelinum TaxID=34275 RepID=A0A5D2V6Z0_GOSMU|nr:hypothetical protein E1A91_D05G412900v1 [Gossypium mustelinum]